MQSRYLQLTYLWIAVILVLTLMPSDRMPETPDWGTLFSFDKMAHAGVYSLLVFLMSAGFREQGETKLVGRNPMLMAFVLSVALGGLVEILQSAMNWGRSGSLLDAVSNTMGCLLGLAAYSLIRKTKWFGLV